MRNTLVPRPWTSTLACVQAYRPGMMRADLGPVVSKAQEDPAGALRASAPEALPSLAPAQGEPESCLLSLHLHVNLWPLQEPEARGAEGELQGCELGAAGVGVACIVCARCLADSEPGGVCHSTWRAQ